MTESIYKDLLFFFSSFLKGIQTYYQNTIRNISLLIRMVNESYSHGKLQPIRIEELSKKERYFIR